MRLVDQCVLSFLHPLEVEMARSVGEMNPARTARLVGAGAKASWLVFAAVCVVLGVVAPVLFPLWTHGRVGFEPRIFALACSMFAANQLGRVCNHALTAANRLYGPSFWMFGCAILSVALGSALTFALGVSGMFVGGLLAELCVSLIAMSAVSRWLSLSPRRLLFDFSGPLTALSALVAFFTNGARVPRGDA
jgi:hypothetical protein